MGDLPILFSPSMILALLREIEQPGTGKTRTRRVLKPLPRRTIFFDPKTASKDQFQGPRYRIGDRLWCRERFAFTDAHEPEYNGSIEYAADGKCFAILGNDLIDTPHGCDPRRFQGTWKPSIHMPRWASRLTLYVTDVKVERLQDISEEDARAEGIECDTDGWRDYQMPSTQCCADPVSSYRTLWDAINGPGAWDANPWVAAYTFAVRAGNIDTLPAEARP